MSHMQPWKRIEPTVNTKIGHRTVVTKLFEVNGKSHDFQTYDKEGQEYAGVVALTKDGQALVIEQFRPGPEKIMYEIPGGFVDEGENPEQQPLQVRDRERPRAVQPLQNRETRCV